MDDKSQNSRKYSPNVQLIRDAYEKSVKDYNASRKSKVADELSRQKFEFKDSNEVEIFSKWTNEQLTLLKNGIAMENAYQSFKQAQQKEGPIPNFNDQMKVSNEEKLKHIYRAEDAIGKLSGVYKELNENVRKFDKEKNEARREYGEKSKEFLEVKAKYDTAKYFRVNIELNRALVNEEKFKAIVELTDHKDDKKQYEAAKKEGLKLKQELGNLYQEMNKSQKMAAAASANIESAPPKLTPPPSLALGSLGEAVQGPLPTPPVTQPEFQPIPAHADQIAQNQMKVVEAQKALEDAKKEAKKMEEAKEAAKAKVKIAVEKQALDEKREKLERSLKEMDGKHHVLLTSVAIEKRDKVSVVETPEVKEKSMLKRIIEKFKPTKLNDHTKAEKDKKATQQKGGITH